MKKPNTLIDEKITEARQKRSNAIGKTVVNSILAVGLGAGAGAAGSHHKTAESLLDGAGIANAAFAGAAFSRSRALSGQIEGLEQAQTIVRAHTPVIDPASIEVHRS